MDTLYFPMILILLTTGALQKPLFCCKFIQVVRNKNYKKAVLLQINKCPMQNLVMKNA
jgi:hypothetical protein